MEMIHRETSRALVLHLLWQRRGKKTLRGILRLDNAFVLIDGHPKSKILTQSGRMGVVFHRELEADSIPKGGPPARFRSALTWVEFCQSIWLIRPRKTLEFVFWKRTKV